MRRVTAVMLTVLCFLCFGCDAREPHVVASQPAQNGQYVLWVLNEYGGLKSGVVSVHLVQAGERPTPRNMVLRTPECTEAEAGWADQETLLIVYDSLYASNFESDLPTGGPRVILIDRHSQFGGAEVHLSSSIKLPCDPF